MTYNPSAAVSVATVLTAATVLVYGYKFGRTHAAWKNVHNAKRAVVVNRTQAWARTVRLMVGTAALLVTFAAAAYVGH
jgi:hypothetical protein